MTNRDFINFVLDDKKVQHDENLYENVIYTYFLNSIYDVEKDIDFNYMLRQKSFTVEGKLINLGSSQDLKYVRSVSVSNFLLLNSDRVLELYPLDIKGLPTQFTVIEGVLENLVRENSYIVLDKTPSSPIQVNVLYYVYTINDTSLIDLDASHPLLKINSDLLYFKLSSYIDKYYNDLTNYKVSLELYQAEKQKELANQKFKDGKIGKLNVVGLERL